MGDKEGKREIKKDKERKKYQLFQERILNSHGFYDGRRIRWLFSFDIFYVKKEKIFTLKKTLKNFA